MRCNKTENEDWIYEYIRKQFSANIRENGVALRDSKLDYINIPLYKYCHVCENSTRNELTADYNIDNFEKEVLFFQNQSMFNYGDYNI